MSTIAWYALAAGVSALGWVLAAAVFRFGHLARCVVSLALPFVVVFCGLMVTFLDTRYPGPVGGWDLVIVIATFGLAAATLLLSLPVWMLLEERLGWKFR